MMFCHQPIVCFVYIFAVSKVTSKTSRYDFVPQMFLPTESTKINMYFYAIITCFVCQGRKVYTYVSKYAVNIRRQKKRILTYDQFMLYYSGSNCSNGCLLFLSHSQFFPNVIIRHCLHESSTTQLQNIIMYTKITLKKPTFN